VKDSVQWQLQVHKALASKPRLAIMRLLREHPQCVNAIASRLRMTQPAVSQHLQLLKKAGLIRAEKRGTSMHYMIDPETLEGYGRTMADVFGGWVKLTKPVGGKCGCPSNLLRECQDKKPVRRTRQGGVS